MSLNKEYKKTNAIDDIFWRELGVSIDSLTELSDYYVNKLFISTMERQRNKVLIELLELHSLKHFEQKEDNIKQINSLELEKKREILILQDFQNRKKASINKYYKDRFNKEKRQYNTSSLTQLKHLFNDSIINIIEAYTLNSWDIKSTGDRYTYENVIKLDEALKIPNEYSTTLIDVLYKGSGQAKKYKVFSYTQIESKVITILYKQISDSTRPDFDKALRNKEVIPLMFSVDTKEKIIEVKGASGKDKINLIKYFRENFSNCNPSMVKIEVFDDYKKEEVINAFLKGESPKKVKIEEFIVNKITFRESPIINSPRLTLELENVDIWPSVIYAHNNNCVNLQSLKDIENLTIKSAGKTRGVRSIILENGNVLFTMDDSRLDETKKKNISDSFKLKFGIPLNQEIANTKFEAGKIDKVDYILKTRTPENLDEDSSEILKELVSNTLINEINRKHFYCKSCNLEREITADFKIEEGCPDCGESDLQNKNIKEYQLNISKIKQYVKKSLKQLVDWEISKSESNIVIGKDKYSFYNLKHKEHDEILQVLIADQSLPISVTNRLKTMMIPTIIVFVGQVEKSIEYYNGDCIQAITFGNLYLTEERSFFLLYNQHIVALKQRYKSYVSNAASIAAISLKGIVDDPSLIKSKIYTNKKFEDDIYAILKDLFPNSAKWGKEASGKPLPEGIFAITHFQKGPTETEHKRVFSYDCKLNEDLEGYDLSKSEQRKAAEYVNTLNNNDIIVNFSDKKELTGHIFVSNKFKEGQFENMQKYFYEKLAHSSNAKPIFINLDVLLKIHKLYRENFEHLSNSRNIFSKYLIMIFSKEVISHEIVDAAFAKVLNKKVQEYDQLDTDSVSEFLNDDIL
ncbi:hypothetical protein [Peribacillus loiseleuriae]|uniref:hypothetical protein n=1 Tax=Peribacillus loiseleuriae TaxID=1679170 RepID=UPI003D011D91